MPIVRDLVVGAIEALEEELREARQLLCESKMRFIGKEDLASREMMRHIDEFLHPDVEQK